MKIREGFVSNSSTYSYLTYIPTKDRNKVVFRNSKEILAAYAHESYLRDWIRDDNVELKISDFGNIMDTEEEFIRFLNEEMHLEIPNGLLNQKDPDHRDNLERKDKHRILRNIDRMASHLQEFRMMKAAGYVPIYVLQSSETEQLAHYLAYIGDTPFRGRGGFPVIY
ncbi:MAG: hypothetical protein INQ03_23960 [Candidatus Heimdallarchaeota archaeon]|nr:hypothetical protein [Candidatus Heimdallarchaeota archaeon]